MLSKPKPPVPELELEPEAVRLATGVPAKKASAVNSHAKIVSFLLL
jgi:hypothetical protein